MLTLEGVTKMYKAGTFGGERVAGCADVWFDIDAGEVISLIGESGSGKTTIGRMVLRLTAVSSGSIFFDGADIAGIGGRGSARYYPSVQGVFQDPFSSYNPIFKADRVFELIRRPYCRASTSASGREAATGRSRPWPRAGGRARQVPAPAERRSAAAAADRAGVDARHQAARRRRDHQHARRVHPDRRAQHARRAEGRGLGVLFITHDLSLGNYISDRDDDPAPRRTSSRWARPAGCSAIRCHSYTKMLLGSVPQLDPSGSRRAAASADGAPGERRRAAHRGRARPLRRASREARGAMTSVERAPAARRAIPWEERPPGASDVLWRSSRNPIIPRDLLPRSNSIFNSAVVPFGDGFAGVFRVDDARRTMNLHAGPQRATASTGDSSRSRSRSSRRTSASPRSRSASCTPTTPA